jgi:hypothetical protein
MTNKPILLYTADLHDELPDVGLSEWSSVKLFCDPAQGKKEKPDSLPPLRDFGAFIRETPFKRDRKGNARTGSVFAECATPHLRAKTRRKSAQSKKFACAVTPSSELCSDNKSNNVVEVVVRAENLDNVIHDGSKVTSNFAFVIESSETNATPASQNTQKFTLKKQVSYAEAPTKQSGTTSETTTEMKKVVETKVSKFANKKIHVKTTK